MGLDETRHIGKIIVDPPTQHRLDRRRGPPLGFEPRARRLQDHRRWRYLERVLYKDDNTGASDLAMDPRDPTCSTPRCISGNAKVGFNGGGPSSGIYRTIDGAPPGPNSSTAAARRQGPHRPRHAGDSRTVYAVVGPTRRPPVRRRFPQSERGETWEHLSNLDPRPMYYSRIYLDPKDANRVYVMAPIAVCGRPTMPAAAFAKSSARPRRRSYDVIDPDNPPPPHRRRRRVSISYDRGLSWLFRLNLPSASSTTSRSTTANRI